METAVIGAVISRVQAVESDVAALRRMIAAEELTVSDHQYLSRCFDLLAMELDAVRQYIGGLGSTDRLA
jgi:hypothetical protein